MVISREIRAAIIKVAGDWAVALASVPKFDPDTDKYERLQPGEMSDELENHFDYAYKFLTEYLRELG